LKEKTMVMHIEPGIYVLKQLHGGPLVEVGRVAVVDGPNVVQHWYLYTAAPEPPTGRQPEYGIYVMPSPRPGTHKSTDVEIFFHNVADTSLGFDPVAYRAPLDDQGFAPRYIRVECDDRGELDRFTGIFFEGQGGGVWMPQLDWGKYRILQNNVDVGEVNVVEVYEAGMLVANKATETWRLFTLVGDGLPVYEAPGSSGGSFRLVVSPTGVVSRVEDKYQHIVGNCVG
jgi:hypothetical protein